MGSTGPFTLPELAISLRFVNRSKRRSIAAFTLAATIVSGSLAACGGDPGTGREPSETSSEAPRTISPVAVATLAQYVGVTPAKAAGEPIRIGYINAEVGPGSSVSYSLGVQEAVRVLNENLGGVKGRPVELKMCHPADAAQALRCAQTFVADPSIVTVLQGTVDADMQGFHSVMSPKIPVLGSLPLSVADASAANAYYLASGQFGGLGVVNYAKVYARARSVALMGVQEFAGVETAVLSIKAALEAVDIKVTQTMYPPTATDLTQAVIASGAPGADLFIPVVVTGAQCVALAKALNQLGVNAQVLTLTGCLNDEVEKSLGDYPRWNYLTFTINAEASAADDLTAWHLRAFNEWFAPLEPQGLTRDTGLQMLQLILTIAKLLNAVPGDTVTPAAAAVQLKKFTGPVFLGVPQLTFGAVPGMPALGSLASRVYAYQGNQIWRDTTSGQWLEPPIQQRPNK
jgi:branched-chain amino acid transport system substrate-binding protein